MQYIDNAILLAKNVTTLQVNLFINLHKEINSNKLVEDLKLNCLIKRWFIIKTKK